MSFYTVTHADLIGPLGFTMKGHFSPVAPDVDGVLTIETGVHNAVIVEAGSVIKGIRLVDEDGSPPIFVVDDAANTAQFEMFMLVSAGAAITLVEESLDVTEASERISVNDEASTAVDSKMVQAFFWPWLAGGVGRVRVFDWAGI